jgi:hypothetical protein
MSWSEVDFAVWFCVHAALVVPTAAQPWLQRKRFKIFARTLLGASSASYLVGVAFGAPLPDARWLYTVLLLLVFALTARGMLWLRGRWTNDPCTNCPLGVYPLCDWNRERFIVDLGIVPTLVVPSKD